MERKKPNLVGCTPSAKPRSRHFLFAVENHGPVQTGSESRVPGMTASRRSNRPERSEGVRQLLTDKMQLRRHEQRNWPWREGGHNSVPKHDLLTMLEQQLNE